MTEQNNTQKEESNVSSETNLSSRNSRRNFLTKAAIGATIASIPAHSVWAGRLISGNMSGNVSGWADECELSILSHGGYKNRYSNLVPRKNFKRIFGGNPIVGPGQTSVLRKNGSVQNLKLSEILSSESGWTKVVKVKTGETGDVYTATPSSALKVTTKDWKKRGSVIGTVYTYTYNVAGPSNVNIQMIAMYLNALNSGSNGVYYPMIGSGKPFSSFSEYADYLYNQALLNPSGVGTQLALIIDKHHKDSGSCSSQCDGNHDRERGGHDHH